MPLVIERGNTLKKRTDRERVRSLMLKLMERESTHDSARIGAAKLLLDMGEDQDATRERVDSLWSALDAPPGYQPVEKKWVPRLDVDLYAIVLENETGIQMVDLRRHFVDYRPHQIAAALKRLREKKLIVSDGAGKAMIYLPAPEPGKPAETAGSTAGNGSEPALPVP